MQACSYVSPSLLPSRTANSIHAVQQCDALGRLGIAVDLYARRALADATQTMREVRRVYGVELSNVSLRTFGLGRIPYGTNVGIAGLAASKIRPRSGHFIHSRNLYASYWFGVLRRTPLIYETHQIELGARAALQKSLLSSRRVWSIVISQRLRELLAEAHGVSMDRCHVLHDAAPRHGPVIGDADRRSTIAAVAPSLADERWRASCGYFGHLYPGRGIEIIEQMAAARPDVAFLIVGGNEGDIAARRSSGPPPNVFYLGFRPHAKAQQLMAAVDVLLMPYQANVSIGARGHDTARFMSPMKMFEYMASGRPIISSDLDVLKEVLRDRETALLVPPADGAAWIAALEELLRDPAAAVRMGEAARTHCARHYTWAARARSILDIASNL